MIRGSLPSQGSLRFQHPDQLLQIGFRRSGNVKFFRIFKGAVDVIVLQEQSVERLFDRFHLLYAGEGEVPVVEEAGDVGEFAADRENAVARLVKSLVRAQGPGFVKQILLFVIYKGKTIGLFFRIIYGNLQHILASVLYIIKQYI